ncbi:MAG: type IX secretion system membrane protein PorP/SprF [Flavobacteriales bacterium]
MKKLLIISFLIASGLSLSAQQLEQWTQFSLNEYTVNPAVSGSDKYFYANAMFRQQWVGVVDAPRTYYMSVQGPIWRDRMGIGGSLMSDVVGALSKNGIQLSYAYHLPIDKTQRLSFSLSTSIYQWAVNGAELKLESSNDIALSNGNMSAWVPDFAYAMRYEWKDLHVGICIPQITNSKLRLFEDYRLTESQMNRHYYFNAGYGYNINSDFKLEGSYFARFVTPVFNQDLQVKCTYKEMVWLGTGVRMPMAKGNRVNALYFMTGYQFENNMVIGYSYDLNFQNVGAATSGSHEVLVGIRFNRRNNKPLLPPAEF